MSENNQNNAAAPRNPPPPPIRLTCEVCGRDFSSIHSLAGHLSSHPDRGWSGSLFSPPSFSPDEFINFGRESSDDEDEEVAEAPPQSPIREPDVKQEADVVAPTDPPRLIPVGDLPVEPKEEVDSKENVLDLNKVPSQDDLQQNVARPTIDLNRIPSPEESE